MSNLSLSVNIIKDRLAQLDSYSSALLVSLHENNPSFNHYFLIEEYLSAQQKKSRSRQLNVDFETYAQVIEDCSLLKYAFVKLYNQLEGLRDKNKSQGIKEKKSKDKKRRRGPSQSITLNDSTSSGTSVESVKQFKVSDFDPYLTFFKNGSLSERIEKSLGKLTVSDGSLPVAAVYETKLIAKFEDLIVSYLIFINFQIVINELLNSNFAIINNLNYYQELQNDNFYYKKLYHLIKIAPKLSVEFLLNIFQEFKALTARGAETGSYVTQQNIHRFIGLASEKIKKNFNSIKKLPYNVVANELSNYNNIAQSSSIRDFDISLNKIGKRTPGNFLKKSVAIILSPINLVINVLSYYADKFFGLFQYPRLVIDGYFSSKVNQLSELNLKNVEKLGALISELPKVDEISSEDITKTGGSDLYQKALEQLTEDSDILKRLNFNSIIKLQYILSNSDLENLSALDTNGLLNLVAKTDGGSNRQVFGNSVSPTVDVSSVNKNSLSNDLIFNEFSSNQLRFLPKFHTKLVDSIERLSRPKALSDYWPLITIGVLYGPYTIRLIYESRYRIIKWLNENLVGTVIKFYQNWIYKPILSILGTIRHDENSQISLTGKKSLKSDIESLERMIVEYLAKHSSTADISNIEAIKLNIREGDLTPFMKDYENQISSPFKNIIAGDLIQSLLIQVQKTKVDGDLVISGIDKLLKSQELVFEFIAILPTSLIVIWLLKNTRLIAKKGWRSVFSINLGKYKTLSKRNLNQLERLYILSSQDIKDHGEGDANYVNYYNVGEIVIETLLLEKNLARVLPNSRLAELKLDIGDLKNKNLQNEYKIKIVEKMWRNYNSYLV